MTNLLHSRVTVDAWCKLLTRMTDINDVEPVVVKLLSEADVETLTKVCGELQVVIPKRRSVFNLLMKHLTSETIEQEADEGLAIFVKIRSDLEAALEEKRVAKGKTPVKKEPVAETSRATGGGTSSASSVSTSATNLGNFAVTRLREFKINGSVGAVDQKDTLAYVSLSFQMQRGKEAGYSSKEIHAAVIKAIKPGSNLRNYLESKIDISERIT